MSKRKIAKSVLDLVAVNEGDTHLKAMENSLSLAQHVEKLGFKRFWISEHHNTASLVSSATPILLGYIAQGTERIRVGSGGVMLPNHTPLIVAEQFGTLATLYPDRIDLGLGRAPGTDQLTAQALRRQRKESVHDFPRDVIELQHYFQPIESGKTPPVRAIPGEGLQVPIYLLGSSLFSANLAAQLGLPYAFASHFAPTHLFDALKMYKNEFQSSEQLQKPYAMAAVNVIIAETDEEAEYLAGSMKLFILNIIRNTRNLLQPPPESIDEVWNSIEKMQVSQMMYYTFVGSKETVAKKLRSFTEATQVDELIIISYIYDHQKRLESFRLLSEIEL